MESKFKWEFHFTQFSQLVFDGSCEHMRSALVVTCSFTPKPYQSGLYSTVRPQWDLQLAVSIGPPLDVMRSPFDDVLTLLLFVLLLGILTPGELYALPGTLSIDSSSWLHQKDFPWQFLLDVLNKGLQWFAVFQWLTIYSFTLPFYIFNKFIHLKLKLWGLERWLRCLRVLTVLTEDLSSIPRIQGQVAHEHL